MAAELGEVETPEENDEEDLVFAKSGRWATENVV